MEINNIGKLFYKDYYKDVDFEKVIVGKESILEYMINNNATTFRNTGLKQKMNKYLEIWRGVNE